MKLAEQTGSSAVWQAANYALVAIMNIVFLVIIVRLLPAADFGVFAIISALLAVVTQFSEVGLGASLVQRKELDSNYISSVFWIALIWSILIYAAIFLVAPVIAGAYEGTVSTEMIRFSGIVLLLAAIGVVPQSLMIREFGFRKLFAVNVVAFFLGHVCIGLGLAFLGFGAWALVAALVATRLTFAILAYIAKPISLSGFGDRGQFNEIFHFGLSLTLARGFNSLAENADKIVLGAIASVTTLGLFERLVYLVKLPLIYLGHIMDSPVFAVMSRADDESGESQKLIRVILTACLASSTLIASYLVIFSEELTRLVLGRQWDGTGHLLVFLGLMIPFNLLARVGDVVVRSRNAMYRSVPRKAIYFIMVAAGTYAGWRYGGLEGVSVVLVVASAVHALLLLHLAAVIIGLTIRDFYNLVLDACRAIAPFVAKTVVLTLVFLKIFPDYELTGAALLIAAALATDAILAAMLFRSLPAFLGERNISIARYIVGRFARTPGRRNP